MSTILLVEEHDDSREPVGPLLDRLGHRALVARNGVEALRILETTIPDLIVASEG